MIHKPKPRSEQADRPSTTSYEIEKNYWDKENVICGVDEAGRGCMAGPVVVAAAILHPNIFHPLLIDSKKLSPGQLLTMYDWLQDKCTYTLSFASARLIDRYNIYQTTAMQMRSAIINLLATTPQLPNLIVIDAMPVRLHQTPFETIEIQSFIKGESKSASIAAASILAKVTRDNIMRRLDPVFPGFNLTAHKGYCTKKHQEQVTLLQPSVIHRVSFLSWLTKETENPKETLHEQTSIFS